MNKIFIALLSAFLVLNISFASQKDDDHKKQEKHDEHDEHGHGEGKAIGAGKAIEVVDEEKGFKLSKQAIKSLSIKLKTVESDQFIIEKATLVVSKDKKGIYRLRQDFFKFLPITLVAELSGKYLIKVLDIIPGDQIVVGGVGLLRVSDIYSTDSSEYGHAH